MSQPYRILLRYMWVSLAAAIATIVIKVAAAWITGSVGLQSDAMESVVNLVAAVVALSALRAAARPPDHNHQFGHGKAEYLSSAVEGGMIFIAAAAIVVSAVNRIINPEPIEEPGFGLAFAAGASIINLVVGLMLIRAGRRHRSIALVADGKHLLTDVWTSVGVVVGVGLVAITDWHILDPLVALGVGANILVTGYRLINRSVVGLLDATLPPDDVASVAAVLNELRAELPVDFHALQTRESGRQRFVYMHVLVPDDWSVLKAHRLCDRVEDSISEKLPGARVFTHVEPEGDPRSFEHTDLSTHPDFEVSVAASPEDSAR